MDRVLTLAHSKKTDQQRGLFRNRKLTLIFTLMAVSIVGLLSSPVLAQTRSPGRPLVRVDQADRLLVMKNGAIMRGQIKTISTGYLVSTKAGYVLITFDQARFPADSLADAYLRLRLEVRFPTLPVHRDLAGWCIRHKLYREAERELRDALRIDPQNESIRQMLDRVQQQIARTAPNKPVVHTQAKFANVAAKPEARSLSGLTQKTAKHFVSVIQPLVSSHCGNARCHGTASKSDFKLTRVRLTSGTHRIASERNLAAMLKFMDLETPRKSKLLKVVTSSHVGKAMFTGRSGHQQIQSLKAWVTTVADEINPDRDRNNLASLISASPLPAVSRVSNTSAFRSPNSRPRNAAAAPAVLPPDVSAPANVAVPGRDSRPSRAAAILRSNPNERPAAARPSSTPQQQPSILKTNFQNLLEEKQPDAFDPEAFNRQYAGGNSGN